MKQSVYVYISVITIVVCLEVVACNPLLFAFKTTTKTSPPVQTNQPVNVQMQNNPNPFFDKLRKFRTIMMALVQKKIDELNIVTATLQSQMRPLQSQPSTGTQLGTPGMLTNLAQQLPGVLPGLQLPGVTTGQQLPGVAPGQQIPGVAPGQTLPGVAPGQQLTGVAPGQQLPGVAPGQLSPALGGLLNPQQPGVQTAPPTLGQQAAVQPGAVNAPVTPQPGVAPAPPGQGQQATAQQGAAGLTNLPVQQTVQPPIATQPATAG